VSAVEIDPAKLAEAARAFANHQGGAGRPRPIWLRRGVSSAYYALFRSIGKAAAAHLLPNGSREQQLQLARSFDHYALKEMCEWIAKRKGKKPPQQAKELIQSLAGTVIDDVASAFCDLQEARHSADYDHLAPFSKASTLGYIQDAETAILNLAAAPAEQREAFFSLLALRTKLR
jgi:hypothetical protein